MLGPAQEPRVSLGTFDLHDQSIGICQIHLERIARAYPSQSLSSHSWGEHSILLDPTVWGISL